MEDPNLRNEFHLAFDPLSPPAPWLGESLRRELRKRRNVARAPRIRRGNAASRPAWIMPLVAGLIGIVILVAVVFGSLSLFHPKGLVPGGAGPRTSPGNSLTAAERAQLALLEARPLSFPPMPAGGKTCPDGPHSTIDPYNNSLLSKSVWGTGHVFAEGGPETSSFTKFYFDVTYYTDPTVRGVVLIRGEQLDRRLNLVFVGDYAAGSAVGVDTVQQREVQEYSELAIPADRPPVRTGAAPGWGVWQVRQGIDRSYIGCTGLQFDTAAGTEVVVAQDQAFHP